MVSGTATQLYHYSTKAVIDNTEINGCVPVKPVYKNR